MASTKRDNERIARILVEAETTGNDRKVAGRHGITDRTLRNWRARLKKDGELSALFLERLEGVELSWRWDLVRTMRVALRRARTLLRKETDLDKVTNLIEQAGGVGTSREALGLDGTSADRARPAAPEAEGSNGGAPAEAGALAH